MPLDLSELEAQNLEVEEIKERVRTVAKKYAKDYRWCDVVNKALREAGIDPVDSGSRVMLDLKMEVSVPADIRLSELVGLTHEDQLEKIKEVIEAHVSIYVKGANTRTASRLVDDFVVTDINLQTPENTPQPAIGTAPNPPSGYEAVFTSEEGKVYHYVPTNGNGYGGGVGRSSLCGQYNYHWYQNSPKSTGGTCRKCSERAASYARNI